MKRIIVYEQHSSASILISRHIRSRLGQAPICIGSFDEEEEGNIDTILRILTVLYREEICGSKLSDAAHYNNNSPIIIIIIIIIWLFILTIIITIMTNMR